MSRRARPAPQDALVRGNQEPSLNFEVQTRRRGGLVAFLPLLRWTVARKPVLAKSTFRTLSVQSNRAGNIYTPETHGLRTGFNTPGAELNYGGGRNREDVASHLLKSTYVLQVERIQSGRNFLGLSSDCIEHNECRG